MATRSGPGTSLQRHRRNGECLSPTDLLDRDGRPKLILVDHPEGPVWLSGKALSRPSWPFFEVTAGIVRCWGSDPTRVLGSSKVHCAHCHSSVASLDALRQHRPGDYCHRWPERISASTGELLLEPVRWSTARSGSSATTTGARESDTTAYPPMPSADNQAT